MFWEPLRRDSEEYRGGVVELPGRDGQVRGGEEELSIRTLQKITTVVGQTDD